jgi:hypothetical protein
MEKESTAEVIRAVSSLITVTITVLSVSLLSRRRTSKESLPKELESHDTSGAGREFSFSVPLGFISFRN